MIIVSPQRKTSKAIKGETRKRESGTEVMLMIKSDNKIKKDKSGDTKAEKAEPKTTWKDQSQGHYSLFRLYL
jgi:hypothetical protein